MQQQLLPPHGFFFKDWELDAPQLVAASDQEARPGFASALAEEFLDTQQALEAKVQALVDLIKRCQRCVAYTGAGLSTAAGIADYATKSKATRAPAVRREEKDWPTLSPTPSHYVLTAMHRAGLLHGWIQQNHDGLPQKAGLPQEVINEIHGSWFDPANPTVGFGEPLREDLFAELLAEELRCDVCLALGTSLCDTPSTADRIAVTPSLRSLGLLPKCCDGEQNAGGLVIVSLQRTRLDALAAIRIYACLDDVLQALGTKLGLDCNFTSAHPHASQREPDLTLHPGDEAVVLAGPDRGCPIEVRRLLDSGDIELQLLGARGAPPRRALLGRWWLNATTLRPFLASSNNEIPPPPSLSTLLSELPTWSAAMVGLPPAPGNKGTPVSGSVFDVAAKLEGLWEGFAARADAGMHRSAQPLRFVLSRAVEGNRLFGGGYSAWPAAGVTGASGRVFFVLQGEVRADGRVRLLQRWERGAADDTDVHRVVASEFVGQVSLHSSGAIRFAGAWKGEERIGCFCFDRTPARWAGQWQVSKAEHADEQERWALAAVPPLLFGAGAPPSTERQTTSHHSPPHPYLLRGAFSVLLVEGALAEDIPFVLWRYASLPPRGSGKPMVAEYKPNIGVQDISGVLRHGHVGEPCLCSQSFIARHVSMGAFKGSDAQLPAMDEIAQAISRYCRVAPR